MKPRFFAALLLAPLCACASNSGGTASGGPSGAATAIAVVETPIYMAFKVPTCFVRTTLLMPAALASTIVPFSNSKEGTGGDYLASNGKANCGPPYIVTPAQVSNEP